MGIPRNAPILRAQSEIPMTPRARYTAASRTPWVALARPAKYPKSPEPARAPIAPVGAISNPQATRSIFAHSETRPRAFARYLRKFRYYRTPRGPSRAPHAARGYIKRSGFPLISIALFERQSRSLEPHERTRESRACFARAAALSMGRAICECSRILSRNPRDIIARYYRASLARPRPLANSEDYARAIRSRRGAVAPLANYPRLPYTLGTSRAPRTSFAQPGSPSRIPLPIRIIVAQSGIISTRPRDDRKLLAQSTPARPRRASRAPRNLYAQPAHSLRDFRAIWHPVAQ